MKGRSTYALEPIKNFVLTLSNRRIKNTQNYLQLS
jgi:hypothetical protein